MIAVASSQFFSEENNQFCHGIIQLLSGYLWCCDESRRVLLYLVLEALALRYEQEFFYMYPTNAPTRLLWRRVLFYQPSQFGGISLSSLMYGRSDEGISRILRKVRKHKLFINPRIY